MVTKPCCSPRGVGPAGRRDAAAGVHGARCKSGAIDDAYAAHELLQVRAAASGTIERAAERTFDSVVHRARTSARAGRICTVLVDARKVSI